jgi:outer membrane protein assembly factor BamB
MSVCPLVKDGRIYRVGGFSPSSQGLDSTSVTAIDAYNGTILWSAKFPGSGRRLAGHNTHPCAIVGDSLFVTSGAACQQVDGLTGAVRHTFEGVRPGCDWGYVGGWNDRLVGSSQGTGVDRETLGVRNFGSPGFSSRPASSRDLFAFDLAGRKMLWTYTGGAILNVSITGDPVHDTLYFVESRNAAALADTTGQMEFSKFLERDATGGAQLVALDAQTGAVRWTQPIARNVDKPDQWILYLTYADGVLLVSRSYFETREDGKTWYGYDFEALDADAGGRTLWQTWKPAPWVNRGQTWKNPLHSHPFYAQGKFWFMARYYGAVFSFDPRTGKETADAAFGTGWEQGEAKSCTTPAASESAFYFRRNSHFLYDLSARRTMDLTRVSRPACWMSIIPACGLVTMLEQSAGCTCGFAIRLSTAFVPRDAAAPPAAAGR